MQAVPIHASAPIQITIRAGVATNSPASMVHMGSHHANTLVRTLPSQSAAAFAVTFVMTSYPAQQLVRAPLVRDPGTARYGTSLYDRTHSSRRFWACVARRGRCCHKKTGTRQSASFPLWPCHTRVPQHRMLNHIADIGSAGWIGEHRGLYILGRQTVADRQAKEVDHFVDVRPNEMGTQDSAGVRIDQCLK